MKFRVRIWPSHGRTVILGAGGLERVTSYPGTVLPHVALRALCWAAKLKGVVDPAVFDQATVDGNLGTQ